MEEVIPGQEVAGMQGSLAFQSYELFEGNGERAAQLEAFRTGETMQLCIDTSYSMLGHGVTGTLQQHRKNLETISVANHDPVAGTPEFRLAEVYFVQALREMASGGQSNQTTIDHLQVMNRELYGEIDEPLASTMLHRVWAEIEKKQDVPELASIISELQDGFTFSAGDGTVLEIPPLPQPAQEAKPLPRIDDEVFAWIQAKLESELQPARLALETYYHEVVASREVPEFVPDDVIASFRQAVAALGYEGIRIVPGENSTILAWSSEEGAVKVGLKRRNIRSVDELLGLFTHEAYVHGLRHVRGADEHLRNGLFTLADVGEQPDYLTFEEGLAATLQGATAGKRESWQMSGMRNYIAIFLAEKGFDSRQAHEVIKRLNLIYSYKPGNEEEQLATAERMSLTSVVRVFRGTPASKSYRASDGSVLHFGKDKAYAAGKLRAINYLNDFENMSEEERNEAWSMLTSAKFDPTNKTQQAYIAAKGHQ